MLAANRWSKRRRTLKSEHTEERKDATCKYHFGKASAGAVDPDVVEETTIGIEDNFITEKSSSVAFCKISKQARNDSVSGVIPQIPQQQQCEVSNMSYPIQKPRGKVHYMDRPKPIEDDNFEVDPLTFCRFPVLPRGRDKVFAVAFSFSQTTDPIIDIDSEVLE